MTSSPTSWPGQIGWRYSVAELWADGIVHALGITLAVAGVISFLVIMPSTSVLDMAAVGVYLATLVLSIVTSAAYNIWPVSRVKWMLRRFDHSAIYLLIAGTYTPFMVKLGTNWLLLTVWLVAALGVILKVVRPGRFDRLSIGLYLALGWSGVSVLDKMMTGFSPATLWQIGIGGGVYSVGVIFHVWDRLRFQNAIWHGFVLTAAAIHFVAVWTAQITAS